MQIFYPILRLSLLYIYLPFSYLQPKRERLLTFPPHTCSSELAEMAAKPTTTEYTLIHCSSHIYGLPIQPALPALPAQPTIQLASPPECQIYSTISVTIWLWRWLQLPIRIKLSACVCLPQSFSPSSLVWVRLGIIIIIYYYYYYNCSLQQQKHALFVCQEYTYITKVVYPSRRAWLTYMVGSVNVCVYH